MNRPSVSPGRGWRNAPVVRERDDRRARWLWKIIFAMLVSAVPLIGYLLQQMDYVDLRYRLEGQRGYQRKLVEAERRLRIERAMLQALPVVESHAAKGIGLVHPSPEQVVVVQGSTSRRGNLKPRAPDNSSTTR